LRDRDRPLRGAVPAAAAPWSARALALLLLLLAPPLQAQNDPAATERMSAWSFSAGYLAAPGKGGGLAIAGVQTMDVAPAGFGLRGAAWAGFGYGLVLMPEVGLAYVAALGRVVLLPYAGVTYGLFLAPGGFAGTGTHLGVGALFPLAATTAGPA
jgi:hypothetical protein